MHLVGSELAHNKATTQTDAGNVSPESVMTDKLEPKIDDDSRQAIIEAVMGRRHAGDVQATEAAQAATGSDVLTFTCVKCKSEVSESMASFIQSTQGLVAVCNDCVNRTPRRVESKEVRKPIRQLPKPKTVIEEKIEDADSRIDEAIDNCNMDIIKSLIM